MKETKGRRLLRAGIGLVLLALLLAPLFCIYAITNLEQAQYNDVYAPAVTQKSYGEALPVVRMDMQEFITVSGIYVSTERFYMELPELRNTYSARMLVNVGDYIESGTLLGYTEDGKRELRATASGIVQEIHLGQSSYLLLENPDCLALRCEVGGETLKVLRRDTLALSDSAGTPVELLEIGKLANSAGDIPVLFGLSGGTCGTVAEEVKLYTGKVYTQALVVSTSCLFHLPEEPDAWYVRIVDENQNVIGNQRVQTGFSDGKYTCITGLAEGTLLDSGYAKIYGD